MWKFINKYSRSISGDYINLYYAVSGLIGLCIGIGLFVGLRLSLLLKSRLSCMLFLVSSSFGIWPFLRISNFIKDAGSFIKVGSDGN